MSFFNDDNIDERLNRLIKIGEVSSVDYAAGTARVVFDDEDSIVSYDLQVLQKNTISNKDYAMPDIGEDVVCLFLPSGEEEGFILGSVYAGEITPPETSGDKRTVVFSDETKISYDRSSHSLTINIGETSIVADSQNVIVDTPAAVTVKGASSATIQAPTITLDGNVTVNGTVTASGDVLASGISLKTHTHTGNLGSPTSPPIGG